MDAREAGGRSRPSRHHAPAPFWGSALRRRLDAALAWPRVVRDAESWETNAAGPFLTIRSREASG